MDVTKKLSILTDAAKYDVACTSSGVDRAGRSGMLGHAVAAGICHSFAADGRCISLLKVLMSNACIYDCKYCINRRSNQKQTATFTPKELADLTINFYRRNYIEGLFLSSAVVKSPDDTMALMCETLALLRNNYRFNGYIHIKAIPGASQDLIERAGMLCDRMSVNVELPSEKSLAKLAPEKKPEAIFSPMRSISQTIINNKSELALYRHAPTFVPAGQSTQLIIGATPESDYTILRFSEKLYKTYSLKRVFFSAYMPIVSDPLLPALTTDVPLLREHRLYQADWLMRFYGFSADEIVSKEQPQLSLYLDPKANWAMMHPAYFPIEINCATYRDLLRVPGIGVLGARRIMQARRMTRLDFVDLEKIGIVLKRARFFITCNGRSHPNATVHTHIVLENLLSKNDARRLLLHTHRQMSLHEYLLPAKTTRSSYDDLLLTAKGVS